MKAYKAFDKDLKCRDFQFEIGTKYKVSGKAVMCENGFHTCGDILSTSIFYKLDPLKSRWAEVEIPDNSLYDSENNKYCSKTIDIIREIDFEEIVKDHFNVCGGSLYLSGCTIPEGLKLPDSIGGYLDLSGCTIPEGLKLPDSIGGYLYLRGCTIPEGLKLPDSIGGSLYLSGCTIPEGFIIPKKLQGKVIR